MWITNNHQMRFMGNSNPENYRTKKVRISESKVLNLVRNGCQTKIISDDKIKQGEMIA